MTTRSDNKKRGAVLKQLREQHKSSVERTQTLLKGQQATRRQISAVLRDNPKTVPEMAAETGLPAHEVLWHITAMKKYKPHRRIRNVRRILPLSVTTGDELMSQRADLNFVNELKAYGAINTDACFNCGNCTAVCPLSKDETVFPRRMIRMAQVGLRDDLINSKELWMCYYCGECTDTCPRGAEPGEFMAAARRYAIASYDGWGLGKLLQCQTVWSVVFLFALGILLGGFLYTQHGPMETGTLALFGFIPYELIHNVGIATILIVGLSGLWNMVNMVRHVVKGSGLHKGVRYNWWSALWETLDDVVMHKRYRNECEDTTDHPRWYLRQWFVHASMMWGFMGLLVATVLDYATDIMGMKATGTWVPIWHPIRFLGTVAGIFLVYGTTVAIIWRLTKHGRASEHSTIADWSFLIMMWLSGITGFALELALYLPSSPTWGYWMFLFHVTVAMEMLLLLPFTKFTHILYRTVALYIAALKPVPEKESIQVPV
jgi:ferredoxin